jgi:hypothetical protein
MPDAAETQMNLGVALSDMGEFEEAAGWLHASLRLRPDSPEAIDNIGMNLARQGKWDEAMTYFDEALAMRPDFPEAHRNRAFGWLGLGDYQRGWPEHEWRLKCYNNRELPVNRPRWMGEDLVGRTILLHAEQGLGDILHFIRFACPIKRLGAWVLAACPDSMVRLIATCPGVDHVQEWYAPVPDCDVHAPLMSLPAILGTTLESLPGECPYFAVPPDAIAVWRPVVERSLALAYPAPDSPAQTFTIGIAWQGNPRNRVDRWRSFPLSHFAHLAKLPGVRLVSLQKGAGTEHVHELSGRFPVAMLHDPAREEEDRRDFLDTAAVMRLVDLVITPDSAIAHLAGGLGFRVWVPLPAVAEWRWLTDREDSPWYPTMTLFRQSTHGDWDSVFRRMADRLSAELGA